MAHARLWGAHKLELEVWLDNAPAIALYASAGFEVEGLRRLLEQPHKPLVHPPPRLCGIRNAFIPYRRVDVVLLRLRARAPRRFADG